MFEWWRIREEEVRGDLEGWRDGECFFFSVEFLNFVSGEVVWFDLFGKKIIVVLEEGWFEGVSLEVGWLLW